MSPTQYPSNSAFQICPTLPPAPLVLRLLPRITSMPRFSPVRQLWVLTMTTVDPFNGKCPTPRCLLFPLAASTSRYSSAIFPQPPLKSIVICFVVPVHLTSLIA